MADVPSQQQTETRRKWKRYPKYKESGIEWLGGVPEEWRKSKIKFHGSVNMGQSPDSEECNLEGVGIPFLQGTAEFGKIHPTPKQFCETAKKNAQKNDILISVRAPVGEINVADQQYGIGRGLSAIGCDKPAFKRHYCWYYLNYSRLFLTINSYGSTYDAVTADDIRNINILIPNGQEQTTIATFLDRETSCIDTLIEKKERQIDLLNEKRAALISHAVTKGLDPNVKMKDSGIEWIGEVPEHWNVKRVRDVCKIRRGQIDPKDERYNQWILISPDHIESGTGRIVKLETAQEQEAISGKLISHPEDVIYCKIRPALNKVCISKGDWLCSADMYPIKVSNQIINKFLLYYFLSQQFVSLMINESMRVAMPKINRDTLKSCPILIPPITEQMSIILNLGCENARLESINETIKHSIDLLKDYRSALISAAVTGKIDVRADVR